MNNNDFYQSNDNNSMNGFQSQNMNNNGMNGFSSQNMNNNNMNGYQPQNMNNNMNGYQSQNMNNNMNGYQSQNMNDNYQNGTYKLILNRKKMYVASLVAFKIFIDNVMVGKIKNGQTLTLDVTPGQHEISINNKNPMTIMIDRDTTADVIIYGANNFGISNINGNDSSNVTGGEDLISKCEKSIRWNLIASIVLPIISVILFFVTDKKYVLQFWFYSVIIGYGIINMTGLKNIPNKNDPAYKSLVVKNIIAMAIGIISSIVTIYITTIGK